MKAIIISEPGGPEVLTPTELPDPVAAHGEVVIDIVAAGINRADLSQRLGKYPPPAGAPGWPGMEASGRISGIGDGVESWSIGDRVCALLGGGGYAEKVAVAASQVLPVPDSVDLVDAAGLPEAIATVWSNVFMTGRLRAGDSILVHGGSSGIGTMSIQLAGAFGALVAVTAGSADKLAACAALGAEILINYREQDFLQAVLDGTGGRGVDVVFDAIGGDYVERNLKALAPHGRLLLIGNQSNGLGSVNVNRMTSRWLSISGAVLRGRPIEEKADIVASVRENVWPLVETGRIVPVIDSRIPLADARLAHERMESSGHIGKILLVTDAG